MRKINKTIKKRTIKNRKMKKWGKHERKIIKSIEKKIKKN